LNAKEVIKLIG